MKLKIFIKNYGIAILVTISVIVTTIFKILFHKNYLMYKSTLTQFVYPNISDSTYTLKNTENLPLTYSSNVFNLRPILQIRFNFFKNNKGLQSWKSEYPPEIINIGVEQNLLNNLGYRFDTRNKIFDVIGIYNKPESLPNFYHGPVLDIDYSKETASMQASINFIRAKLLEFPEFSSSDENYPYLFNGLVREENNPSRAEFVDGLHKFYDSVNNAEHQTLISTGAEGYVNYRNNQYWRALYSSNENFSADYSLSSLEGYTSSNPNSDVYNGKLLQKIETTFTSFRYLTITDFDGFLIINGFFRTNTQSRGGSSDKGDLLVGDEGARGDGETIIAFEGNNNFVHIGEDFKFKGTLIQQTNMPYIESSKNYSNTEKSELEVIDPQGPASVNPEFNLHRPKPYLKLVTTAEPQKYFSGLNIYVYYSTSIFYYPTTPDDIGLTSNNIFVKKINVESNLSKMKGVKIDLSEGINSGDLKYFRVHAISYAFDARCTQTVENSCVFRGNCINSSIGTSTPVYEYEQNPNENGKPIGTAYKDSNIGWRFSPNTYIKFALTYD